MINAWSLLYEELNGTIAKTYPINDDMSPCKIDTTITSLESDEYDPKPKSDSDDTDWNDPIITVGSGNTASTTTWVDSTDWENITIDTSNCPVTLTGLSTDQLYTIPPIEEPICTANLDDIVFTDTGYVDTLNINLPDDYPSAFTAFSDNDDSIAHLIDKPVSSGIEDQTIRKYKEDESIQALKDYISTTYGGHYTSDNNNVQTLDLIESVGDADSFCRSNAIKYLSRYDKKGQAKRDILKALHYSLLLYHFSGQLNETPTRGYETF